MCRSRVYTTETKLVLFRLGFCKFKILIVTPKETSKKILGKKYRKGKKDIKIVHHKKSAEYPKRQ